MSKISLPLKQEHTLVKNIKRGGKPRQLAWQKVYQHYQPHLLNFFRSKTSSEPDSQDLTSLVFKKALEGIDNFQWQGVSLSAWLYTIARRNLIDYYRQKGRRDSISIDKIQEPSGGGKGPEEQTMIAFQTDRLWQALRKLPPREYKIVYMKFFEGYTNRTISKLTGLSETNVGTIIYRVIKRLRDTL